MADGLPGHEMDFYGIVGDSPWLGGTTEYSVLNEGFPYWFNGLVALAYGLDDATLKTQVQNSLDYVLSHQQADGWLGPETNVSTRDIWGRFPFFLGLTQLVEADSSQAASAIPAMYKFVNLMHDNIQSNQSYAQIWSQSRYADMILSLQWLYEHYPESNEALLLSTMNLLRNGGVDWASYFTEANYIFADLDTVDEARTEAAFSYVHAVNAGQGLKALAVDYRFTSDSSLLTPAQNGVDWTFEYHGAASGTILGDERESGLAPYRGSELCTAVETMFSLSYLYHTLGTASLADRAELTAYNALPVMYTADQWAHQYIAQPNQPWSRQVQSGGLFWNVNDYGQTYGLAPNYPCCTVNSPQGYPKFLSASYVTIGNDGLGHALLAPASVSTTLGNGAVVTASCDTEYPFADTLSYSVQTTQPMTFSIRLPAWSASGYQLTSTPSGVVTTAPAPDSTTGLLSVPLPAGQTNLTLTLAPALRTTPRANDTIAIYHGTLLYALDVGEVQEALPPTTTTELRPVDALGRAYHPEHYAGTGAKPNFDPTPPPESHDYVINNTLPWAYAVDPATLVWHASNDTNPTSASATDLDQPWAYHAPKSFITGMACQIEWPLDNGVPGPVPLSGERNCTGDWEQVVFRPYGSLRVRMAELPVLTMPG